MDAPKPKSAPLVDFIIPTFRRPEFLKKCLLSIRSQTVSPASVFVGIRPDDIDSQAVVKEAAIDFPVHPVEAKGVGVIGSMSSCLKEATANWIVLVDDDVELPPHWLETMLGHLAKHPKALGAAGRDFLQDHPEMRRSERRVEDVGVFHWYGRLIGNHHRGGGEAQYVDILRGSNCLFDGRFLREVGFEQHLRGTGAQVSWELALACHALRRGKHFFYDPDVEVLHHVAPRHDCDTLHRGGFDTEATTASAFNETYVMARHAPGIRRLASILFQAIIGSAHAPGIVHVLRQVLRADRHVLARWVATKRGRLAALRSALAHSSPSFNMRVILRKRLLRIPVLRQLVFYRQEEHARRVTDSPALSALTHAVWRQTDGVVQSGPFAGMKYRASTHGSMLLPKVLGTYENELHSIVNRLIALPAELVIDIGAAEGYYAVGFALRKSQATVIAYEASWRARRQLLKLAKLNGVEKRMLRFCLATLKDLQKTVRAGCIVICDVEGAEAILLDPVSIPALRQSTILFEAHDDDGANTGGLVAARFAETHRSTKVAAIARGEQDWPTRVMIDRSSWPGDIGLALNEFRHAQQHWYLLEPLPRIEA